MSTTHRALVSLTILICLAALLTSVSGELNRPQDGATIDVWTIEDGDHIDRSEDLTLDHQLVILGGGSLRLHNSSIYVDTYDGAIMDVRSSGLLVLDNVTMVSNSSTTRIDVGGNAELVMTDIDGIWLEVRWGGLDTYGGAINGPADPTLIVVQGAAVNMVGTTIRNAPTLISATESVIDLDSLTLSDFTISGVLMDACELTTRDNTFTAGITGIEIVDTGLGQSTLDMTGDTMIDLVEGLLLKAGTTTVEGLETTTLNHPVIARGNAVIQLNDSTFNSPEVGVHLVSAELNMARTTISGAEVAINATQGILTFDTVTLSESDTGLYTDAERDLTGLTLTGNGIDQAIVGIQGMDLIVPAGVTFEVRDSFHVGNLILGNGSLLRLRSDLPNDIEVDGLLSIAGDGVLEILGGPGNTSIAVGSLAFDGATIINVSGFDVTDGGSVNIHDTYFDILYGPISGSTLSTIISRSNFMEGTFLDIGASTVTINDTTFGSVTNDTFAVILDQSTSSIVNTTFLEGGKGLSLTGGFPTLDDVRFNELHTGLRLIGGTPTFTSIQISECVRGFEFSGTGPDLSEFQFMNTGTELVMGDVTVTGDLDMENMDIYLAGNLLVTTGSLVFSDVDITVHPSTTVSDTYSIIGGPSSTISFDSVDIHSTGTFGRLELVNGDLTTVSLVGSSGIVIPEGMPSLNSVSLSFAETGITVGETASPIMENMEISSSTTGLLVGGGTASIDSSTFNSNDVAIKFVDVPYEDLGAGNDYLANTVDIQGSFSFTLETVYSDSLDPFPATLRVTDAEGTFLGEYQVDDQGQVRLNDVTIFRKDPGGVVEYLYPFTINITGGVVAEDWTLDLQTEDITRPGGPFRYIVDTTKGPVLQTVPLVQAEEFVSFQVDLGTYITDPDTDLQDITMTIPEFGFGTATVNGFVATITIDQGSALPFTIPVLLDDGTYDSQWSFQVLVEDINQPPTLSVSFPVVTINEDSPFGPVTDGADTPIYLDEYITDPDGGLTFWVVPSEHIEAELGVGLWVDVRPDPNWHGNETVTIIADDGEFNITFYLPIQVLDSDNDPPVVDNARVSLQIIIVEDQTTAEDITGLFSDIDTPILDLQVMSSDHVTVIMEDDDTILLIPDADWSGTEEVQYHAFDGETTVTAFRQVVVTGVNDPPQFLPYTFPEIIEDTPTELDLAGMLYDMDDSDVDLTISTDPPLVILEGRRIQFLYNMGGTYDLGITVSDGSRSVTNLHSFTVQEVNDRPTLGPIAPVTLTEGLEYILDLSTTVMDEDDPIGGLSITTNDPGADQVGRGTGLFLRLLFDEPGERTIVYSVFDGSDVNTSSFLVDVLDASSNIAPRLLQTMDPISLQEDASPASTMDLIDLTDHFFDDEELDFSFTVTRISGTDDGSGLGATITGDSLSLELAEDMSGSFQMDIVATDLFKASTVTTLMVTVVPVNDPPAIAEIPDIKGSVDFTTSFDLGGYIADPDDALGDLFLSLAGGTGFDDIGTAYIDTSGDRRDVVLSFSQAGDTTVTITVFDGEFLVTREIPVHVVADNAPPQRLGYIPNGVGLEDTPFTRDIRTYFADPDGDALSFSVLGVGEGASVSVQEGNITLTPDLDFSGTVELDLRVSDPFSSYIEDTFWVTFEAVNDPPTLFTIPPFNVSAHNPYQFDLTPFIHDLDSPLDDLSVVVEHQVGGIVDGIVSTIPGPRSDLTELDLGTTYILSGNELNDAVILVVNLSETGEETYRITLSDGETSVQKFMSVTVVINDPPVALGVLPKITIVEDAPATTIMDLSEYFIDDDRLTYTLGYTTGLDFLMNGNDLVVIPDPDHSGLSATRVVARDIHNGEADGILYIEVLPVNDPPEFLGLPELRMTPGNVLDLDLTPYIRDVDNSLGDITLTTSTGFVEVDGLHILVTPPDSITGTVTLTILDKNGGRSTTHMIYTVNMENQAPVLTDTPDPLTLDEDGYLLGVLDLDEIFSDTDVLSYTWSTSEDDVVATITKDGLVNIRSLNDFFGHADIEITGTDPFGASASLTIPIDVTSINDPPRIKDLPPFYVTAGFPTAIPLEDLISDPDGTFENIVSEVVENLVVKIMDIDGVPTLVINYSTSTVIDGDFFVIQARDIHLAQSRKTFHVIINRTNLPPTGIVPSISINVAEDEVMRTPMRLSEKFTDPDGDPLRFTILGKGDDDVTVIIRGDRLTVEPAPDFSGDVSLTVRASDPSQAYADIPLTIHVTPVNDPPRLDPFPPLEVLEGLDFSKKLDVFDPDSSSTTLSVRLFYNDAIKAPAPNFIMLGSANDTIWFVADDDDVGRYIVQLTVSDDSGTSDSFEFELDVLNRNDPPRVEAITTASSNLPYIPGLSISRPEKTFFSFDIQVSDEDSVHYPGGAVPLTFTLVEGPDDAQLSVSTGTFGWRPGTDDVGLHTLIIRVSDLETYTDARVELTVTNLNDAPSVVITSPSIGLLGAEASYSNSDTETVTFSAVGTVDHDGDPLSFSWSSDIDGQFLGLEAGEFRLTPGTHVINLIVSDGLVDVVETFDLVVRTAKLTVTLISPNSVSEGSMLLQIQVENSGDAEAVDIPIQIIDRSREPYIIVYDSVISSIQPRSTRTIDVEVEARPGDMEFQTLLDGATSDSEAEFNAQIKVEEDGTPLDMLLFIILGIAGAGGAGGFGYHRFVVVPRRQRTDRLKTEILSEERRKEEALRREEAAKLRAMPASGAKSESNEWREMLAEQAKIEQELKRKAEEEAGVSGGRHSSSIDFGGGKKVDSLQSLATKSQGAPTITPKRGGKKEDSLASLATRSQAASAGITRPVGGRRGEKEEDSLASLATKSQAASAKMQTPGPAKRGGKREDSLASLATQSQAASASKKKDAEEASWDDEEDVEWE